MKRSERVSDQNITRLGDALLACNIHDWMAGYVFTVNTPLHGKTDSKGTLMLTIPDEGQFTAIVWHPQLDDADQSQAQTFLVKETTALTFQLTKEMAEIPTQDSEEIFDFLDDY